MEQERSEEERVPRMVQHVAHPPDIPDERDVIACSSTGDDG